MGAESTFTYQNFNIERGIVWNQENAINRGIQVNQTMGKYLTASISWNDGYYSNRYSWLSGSVTFTKGPHSPGVRRDGEPRTDRLSNGGYAGAEQRLYARGDLYATPRAHGSFRRTSSTATLPTNTKVGVTKGTSATGGAINVSYAFKSGFSLPARVEYLTSSGSATDGSVNLLGFGAGSAGTTFTATPTYQKGGMYVRGDLAWVHATNYTPGDVFGKTGTDASQFRGVLEFGFIFGNNIEK